ncbi:MAG: DUF501 domain-containing protein [Acidimicrobiales bacterium]
MKPAELAQVTELLGRAPRGRCEIVVRARDDRPVVLKNSAHLDDGTPMPTTYWLIGQKEHQAVSRLEAAGGVKAAERAVDPRELAAAHEQYALERDRAVDAGAPGHHPHHPSGGVGGTRVGVKCLHAHFAWYLAGGDDPVGRWTARELGLDRESYRAQTGAVAAVDCGTNSTRLLVLGPDGRRLDRRMTITRLGAGVDRTGTLDLAAIERTVKVLEEFGEVIEHHGVARTRVAATSATRDASNSATFLDAAEAILQVRPEVIEGSEEGRLSYRGATASLDPRAGPYLVVDIGGGSTELIIGEVAETVAYPAGQVVPSRPQPAPAAVVSLDVGCVRLTERFFHSDPPSSREMAAARARVRELVEARILGGSATETGLWRAGRSLIGLAGTVSALTVMALGLDGFDETKVHHAKVSRSSVGELTNRLAGLSLSERRELRGMEVERADVIVGGAVVLEEVMDAFGYTELTSSESDILDGIAAELLSGPG